MSGRKRFATTAARINLVALESREVPTVTATPDNFYEVQAGEVLTAGFGSNSKFAGVLANDQSNTNPNAVLAATVVQGVAYTGANAPPLPTGSLNFAPNGSFTFITPSNYVSTYGDVVFFYRAIDTLSVNDQSVPAKVTITVTPQSESQSFYATGAGAGSEPRVRVYEAGTGLLKYDFLAYEESFRGGVRVATGDLTGDGVDDIATAPARTGGARVKVYDGATGIVIEDFFAVDPGFRGGAYVAIGDVDGNRAITTPGGIVNLKSNDLIVGAGEGGGPRVTIYNGAALDIQTNGLTGTGGNSTFSTSILADFFAYDVNTRSGVQVAAGNLSGINDENARDFLVTAPGPGGGPLIRVFDGRKLDRQFIDPITNLPAVFSLNPTPGDERSFFAFSPNSRAGANIAVGRFRGNDQSGQLTNAADIIVGSGDGTPIVRVFDGRSSAQLREFIVPLSDSPTGSIPGTNVGTGGGSAASASNFGGASSGGGLVSSSSTAARGQQTGGARVAVINRDSDSNNVSDIITAIGPGNAPRIRIFEGNTFEEIDNVLGYPANFMGGVFVGGNSL